MHYQPLFYVCSGQEMAKSKCCKFIKKYFFIIKLPHAHYQYVCNISAKHLKNTLNALGGVDFTIYALSAIIQYVQWSRILAKLNCCIFIKIYFFIIKLPHAHYQYVCNISAKHLKNTLNALGGVDFTKYALLALLQTPYS